MWVRVRFVIDYAVHKSRPISQAGTCETVLCNVIASRAVEINSRSGASEYAAVNQRQFPIVPVVYLLASDKDGRASEQGADPGFAFVFKAPEILLEGKQLLDRIFLGFRVVVVVTLRECILLELCPATRRKHGYKEHNQYYGGESLHYQLIFSRAARNASTSASELNLMVREPFPEALRLSEMSLLKYGLRRPASLL